MSAMIEKIKAFFRNMGGQKDWDKQYTGAYPRNSGAKSAVSGGSPEDLNGMPATGDINHPIFDGSSLGKPGEKTRSHEAGKVGWAVLWLLGVPIPVLLVLFAMRGCT